MKTNIISFIALTLLALATTLAILESRHVHVKAKHYITKYKTATVTYCLTQDKIVTFNGEHIDIIAPTVLFPNAEPVK